jgi:hypothetical protein
MSRKARTSRWIVACVWLSWAGAGRAAETAISERARELFKSGVSLLRAPEGARVEEAYRAFKAAYDDSPSAQILGNLGYTAMLLERDGEAIAAIERYLGEVRDLDATEREQFARDLQVLKTNVGWIALAVEPSGAQLVDTRLPVQGDPVVNRYGPVGREIRLGVRPGHHRLEARREGFTAAVVEIEVAPGASLSERITLTPVAAPAAPKTAAAATPAPAPAPVARPEEPERPIPAGVWIGLAATGTLAAGAGLLGALSLANRGDYDAALESGDLASASELRDRGVAMNIAGDVLLGGAVVAAAVTAVLFFTRPEAPASAARLRPLATPVVPGLGLDARF